MSTGFCLGVHLVDQTRAGTYVRLDLIGLSGFHFSFSFGFRLRQGLCFQLSLHILLWLWLCYEIGLGLGLGLGLRLGLRLGHGRGRGCGCRARAPHLVVPSESGPTRTFGCAGALRLLTLSARE